jgi:hypothetical protein
VKRALDALKDFRIDVEEGEEMVRTVQPVHIDRTKPRPKEQTIRLVPVKLRTGDLTSDAELNQEQSEEGLDMAVRILARNHMERWLNGPRGRGEMTVTEMVAAAKAAASRHGVEFKRVVVRMQTPGQDWYGEVEVNPELTLEQFTAEVDGLAEAQALGPAPEPTDA